METEAQPETRGYAVGDAIVLGQLSQRKEKINNKMVAEAREDESSIEKRKSKCVGETKKMNENDWKRRTFSTVLSLY